MSETAVKKQVRVVQIASGLGRKPGQIETLIGLGLNQDAQGQHAGGYPPRCAA